MAREVVPEVDGLIDSKWPEVFRERLGPVLGLMHHHSSCPRSNGLHSSFGHTVLKVCSNSAKVEDLFLQLNVFLEEFRVERLVIGSISFDSDAVLPSKTFELVLGAKRFASSEGDLVTVVDEGRSMIDPDRTATILGRFLLFPKRIG